MTREEAIKEILAVVCDIPLGEIKLNSTHVTPRSGVYFEHCNLNRRTIEIATSSLNTPASQFSCAEDVAELGMYLIKLAIKMKENE